MCRHRDSITAALRDATGGSEVIWRPLHDILKQEGLEPPPEAAAEGAEGSAPEAPTAAGGDGAAGAPAASARAASDVQITELGVRYWASPYGQKTGFYADQRESRAFVAGLAKAR